MRGHVGDDAELRFKEGDQLKSLAALPDHRPAHAVRHQRPAYTLKAADLPRGRGDGQPVRLLADLTNEDDVAALFIAAEGARYLVASSTGRGFVVPAADLAAEKRTGKQVLNLRPGEEAALCVPADGDHVAIIGSNRKLLIFPLEQVPEMARGGGVILQRYKDGGLADAKVFRASGWADVAARRQDAHRDQPARLDRRARAGRPAAAERLSRSGRFS